MKKNIEKIIEDICTLAPELGEKKQEVRKLVEALIEQKPNITVDSAFVEELRMILQREIRAKRQSSVFDISAFFQTMTRSRVVHSFVAVVLIVLVALPFVNLSKQSRVSEDVKIAVAPQVKDAQKKGAFGSLVSTIQAKSQDMLVASPQTEGLAYTDASRNAVSPSNRTMVAPSMYMTGENQDMTVSSDSPSRVGAVSQGRTVMPPWGGYYQYPVYTFEGTLPAIDAEGYVYRREPGIASENVDEFLDDLDLGLLDIGSFQNATVQRIELTSKGDPSYSVSVDLERGDISITRVWQGGDMPYDLMKGNDTDLSQTSDASVIAIAQAFLSKHGIDVSSYGAPKVQKPMYYYATPMAENTVSDSPISSDYVMPYYNLTVVYPLVIDGKKVVEQDGSPVGISVSVNVPGKFVESVYGLSSQQYERSLYPLLQDKEKILEMVKNGGYGQNYYAFRESDAMTQMKMLSIPVDNPELVLMRYWKYEQNASQPTELLVPALMFDIDQESWNSKGIYVQNAIVIPLVEELIQDQWNQPVPVPLMKGGVGIEGSTGASSGSVGAGTTIIEPQPAAVGD